MRQLDCIVINMIRKSLTHFVYPFVYLISHVFTYDIFVTLRRIRDYLYTLWIRSYIGTIGDNSTISYPCTLEGGGLKNISIGNCTYIHGHCILGGWKSYGDNQSFSPEISIGNFCCIGEYSQLSACKRITIGDGLLTGRFVYIGDNAHGRLSLEEANIRPTKRHLVTKGEISIGKNVWIGDKVTILGGVSIGDNVIIGSNSVVTHNLPSNCVAVGSPAKVVKLLS